MPSHSVRSIASTKRACMVAYTFYESDNRVRRYAETLAENGFKVDAFALRRRGEPRVIQLKGVTVYKIQKREVNERGQLSYLFRILKFLARSAIDVSKQHHLEPYSLIHVHSVPDFEVFSACIPKIHGAKVILDIHDLVPEFYSNKFENGKKGFLYNALVITETISAKFANHVIVSNHLWHNTLISRSVPPKKCTAIINYPDKKFFFPQKPTKTRNYFIFLYPGTLNWHQGLDIAIKSFAIIHSEFPRAQFHIYGEGPARNSLIELCQELHVEENVIFKRMISAEEIPDIMAKADAGIVPKRNDSFGGDAFSTKTLEFMALEVPIILSRTRIDSFYFNDDIVRFFDPENVEDLAEAMREFLSNRKKRKHLAINAKKFVNLNNWETKKQIYLNLIDDLT